MERLHFEMIFKKDGIASSKDVYLMRDEMFNTYRYVSIWDPMAFNDVNKRGFEDLIWRGSYPNIHSAIKALKEIENLSCLREITDYTFHPVDEFIELECGKEE